MRTKFAPRTEGRIGSGHESHAEARERRRQKRQIRSPIVLGVPHSLTGTSKLMLYNFGGRSIRQLHFPLSSEEYEESFVPYQRNWRVLILCEPLSVVVAYEQRRGHLYDSLLPNLPNVSLGCAFDAFCNAWLALWNWLKDAKDREVYPNEMYIICMDRLHHPLREGIFDFESTLGDVKEMIANRDLLGLMRNKNIAPYIDWMRQHRDIFEFVDHVGRYESGWWLT